MMTVLVSMVIVTLRREFVQIGAHGWKMIPQRGNEALMTKE